MDLLTVFANEFNIPIIYSGHKVWFFRTNAGKYYTDFFCNNFIALGWDLIPPKLIIDKNISRESKRDQISVTYPDEKRPGLILSQMDIFYNKMSPGDLVIIPSEGSKEIAIGRIGELTDCVDRSGINEGYEQCVYVHKRNVEWLKIVYAWQDIYLFKSLKAHQTISDITEDSKLVFRNFYPIYISGELIHFTLQKPTDDELSVSDNVILLSSILNVVDRVSELYSKESVRSHIKIKTAVGSPGFFELIAPAVPAAVFAIGIIKWFIGKEKSADGSTTTGLLALITKVNELINDYHNRKNIDAETKMIEAQTAKTYVETAALNAQIAKTNAETRQIELENTQIELLLSGKTTEDMRRENEKLFISGQDKMEKSINEIVVDVSKLCEAAENTGLSYAGEKIEKIAN